ncbi:dGTPase [Pseudoalteromonas sp. 1181_04]|uniref:dGTPase n=1 Tax=Pseudoalteromonas sp. 1181_04 TaxID=2604450 RepID=UPI004063BF5B
MENLNSIGRHRLSTADHDSLLASTQSDRARLIYSAAFRRLQQKAQVFSLESNSSVRSRLTHSIEVSHIGRYIVAKVLEKIAVSDKSDEIKKYWENNSLSLSNIVETACLMHDIGNPPFGHFGEAAVSEWAGSLAQKEWLNVLFDDAEVRKSLTLDLTHFDGNPQGFRIITKLQGDDGFYGLNLTYTQLVAFLKYTYTSTEKAANDSSPFSKKIGYFSTEEKVIKSAWKALEMPENSRHPLGFLMEASDDISYCISDIEDGIEKKIINMDHFKKEVIRGLNEVAEKHQHPHICNELIGKLNGSKGDSIGIFLSFKTKLSNFLVDSVAEKYVSNYESICGFDEKEELVCEGTLSYDLLKVLKVYTGDFLFTSEEAECMELSGFKIILGILEEFECILKLKKEHFIHLLTNDFKGIKKESLHRQRRLFNRLPEKHLNAYKAAVLESSILKFESDCRKQNVSASDKFKETFNALNNEVEWKLRLHLIIDFVSGMTDQYSMEFFQMVKGINVYK